MSGKTYKVISAYVTLRVADGLGQEVLQGFHQGATVPEGVNQDDLDRHVRKNLVAEEGSREAGLLAVPAGTPKPGEPPNPSTEGQTRSGPAADEGRRTRRSG
ncbi:hypothetical protein E1091_17145 [Micromonospora fluostatini]|uniref:Uncharacterized protein n=1 Tax=Micromonospora fluostatini TaxID=1629071 RepID=A0ABY2DD34_9ACTN|nr:hypothetical protein E1091_17145 [Micromonospora fluostatini]